MTVLPAEFAAELKVLRKGRGIYSADLDSRAGPALREACGITDEDGPAVIRDKLANRLAELAKRLPEELSVAVTAALAIHPDARHLLLQERVEWLTGYLRRDVRTARRRIDEGIERLAEVAAAPAPTVPSPVGPDGDEWYVEEFFALLRMDQPVPEAIERRRIVSERAGLAEIGLAMTLPRDHGDLSDAHDLHVEALYGGRLLRKARVTDSRFDFVLELPAALRLAERHEYGMMFRLPPDQPMRTHYVFTSPRRCDLFDLRIKFAPERAPRQLWPVAAAFHREVDERRPGGDLRQLDRAGEIHVQFRNLVPGFGYGIQWQP